MRQCCAQELHTRTRAHTEAVIFEWHQDSGIRTSLQLKPHHHVKRNLKITDSSVRFKRLFWNLLEYSKWHIFDLKTCLYLVITACLTDCWLFFCSVVKTNCLQQCPEHWHKISVIDSLFILSLSLISCLGNSFKQEAGNYCTVVITWEPSAQFFDISAPGYSLFHQWPKK